MKYLKKYDNYKEIYDIDPNKEVVIQDKYLSKINNFGAYGYDK